jgi:hypothetical protein
LTFPSLGTFDSIWQRIDREMGLRGLAVERDRLAAHVAERPSAKEARGWLEQLEMERITVVERPLEVASEGGQRFLQHPLLRGGFLDDAYECFDDATVADEVMGRVSQDLDGMRPLIAQRCALSGWKR